MTQKIYIPFSVWLCRKHKANIHLIIDSPNFDLVHHDKATVETNCHSEEAAEIVEAIQEYLNEQA